MVLRKIHPAETDEMSDNVALGDKVVEDTNGGLVKVEDVSSDYFDDWCDPVPVGAGVEI